MGLFDFLKKKQVLDQSQAPAKNAPERAAPKPMVPNEYQTMRDYETQWLETNYDFNSIRGINRIPLVKHLRCTQTSGVTGELYYYLRHKAYEHEKAGRMDLALACMQKSAELSRVNESTMKGDYYPLVKMLAYDGKIEEAKAKKKEIDELISELEMKQHSKVVKDMLSSIDGFGSDLVIMSVHGNSCPECAKYQGRVYSVYGKDKRFPKVPDFFYRPECVHPGCGHTFFSFIYGVNDPGLNYTLKCNPIKKKWYSRNIIAFSNRPFVDDRTNAAKANAAAYMEKRIEEESKEKYIEDNMIEFEAKRGQEARDFRWLQENIPEKCPKSVTGYRRMKTQNTKNYQILKHMAAELGREI